MPSESDIRHIDQAHRKFLGTARGLQFNLLSECGTIFEANCQYVGAEGYTCYVGKKDPKTRELRRCGRLKIGKTVTFAPRD